MVSQGVIIIYIAKTYDIGIATVGYYFFIPSVVLSATIYGYGYLLERVNLKRQVLLGLLCMGISIALICSGVIALFIIGLFVMGVGYGILLCIPNHLLVNLHPEDKFKKLNLLNFFYSAGGFIGPFLLGQMIGFRIPWQLAYLSGFIFIAILILYNRRIPYSLIKDEGEHHETSPKDNKWNFSAYCIIFCLLFYVLSEFIFSTWIVYFLKAEKGYSIASASMGLTIYWIFIALGRFAFSNIAKKMRIYVFILLSCSLIICSFPFIYFVHQAVWVYAIIAITGTGFASLYASLLSYGMEQKTVNDPRLMTTFVAAGSTGIILALPISSFFVHHFGVGIALLSGLIMLLIVVILIIATLFDKTNRLLPKYKT